MCTDPNLAQLSHTKVRHKSHSSEGSKTLKVTQPVSCDVITKLTELESSKFIHTHTFAQVILFSPVGVDSAYRLHLKHSESTYLNIVTFLYITI